MNQWINDHAEQYQNFYPQEQACSSLRPIDQINQSPQLPLNKTTSKTYFFFLFLFSFILCWPYQSIYPNHHSTRKIIIHMNLFETFFYYNWKMAISNSIGYSCFFMSCSIFSLWASPNQPFSHSYKKIFSKRILDTLNLCNLLDKQSIFCNQPSINRCEFS